MSSPAQYEYQLFELDRVERAFKSIIANAVSTPSVPVQVLMKREKVTTNTPRVELVLETKQVQGQRKILNPAAPAQFQPLNTWFYNLSASVITNRSTNGSQHETLCGIVRLNLQLYKLAQTWTLELAPYHTIIDSQEQAIDLAVESDGDLDTTKMNFAGMLCIRDGAWPQ